MSDSGQPPVDGHPREPLAFTRLPEAEMTARAAAFLETALGRRSVREFSPEPVPAEVIELAIRAAASAPSGANMQPWKFVVVRDPELKQRIRLAAEKEEKESYENRMPGEWIAALEPLGTDWHKEFLEVAPLLIVVFREDYRVENGVKLHNYYVGESVGIACGILLAALNAAGLATLTHTPSPMGFLREILERPANEKPYLLIPVGYPARDCTVPAIRKKSLTEVMLSR